jgi:APA family basic amino acid/polyamine antiporter
MSLLTIPFSWAAQALIFANYFGTVVSLSPLATHLVAALLISSLCAIQYRSVGLGAVVQNVSTGAKLLALAGLAITLFAFAPHPGATLASAGNGEVRWSGILIALVAALWAYDGWANLTTLSGEISDPVRNLPRALIGGTLLTLAIYLVINAAFAVALPFAALSASTSVAADAVTAVLGQGGAAVVAALVMVSTFGSLNGSILSDSRIFYAMAEDGLFFKSVGSIHPRFGTPHVAILFTSLLAVVYVLSRDFLQLAEAYILGTWPFLALCVIGLFVLRKRQAGLTRPYKAQGYPVIPILFVLGTFTVIGFTLYKQPVTTGLNFAVILLGLPVYWTWTRWR